MKCKLLAVPVSSSYSFGFICIETHRHEAFAFAARRGI